MGVCLHQRLATVGGPIPTFDVTADGSIGRSTAIPRPCKQQSVAFCVRHWSFGRSQLKENVASDGGKRQQDYKVSC